MEELSNKSLKIRTLLFWRDEGLEERERMTDTHIYHTSHLKILERKGKHPEVCNKDVNK